MGDFDKRAGGVLFPNRKTTARQPDFTGEIIIDGPLLMHLSTLMSAGKPLKLRLAGWKKKSAKGNDFLSLLPSAEDAERGQPRQSAASAAPGYMADDPFDSTPF